MRRSFAQVMVACLVATGCQGPTPESPRGLHDRARLEYRSACIDKLRFTNQPLLLIEQGCRAASWHVYPPRR